MLVFIVKSTDYQIKGMKTDSYNKSGIHDILAGENQTELIKEMWLGAVLENTLVSIIVLKSVRKNGSILDFEYAFLNRKAEDSLNGSATKGKLLRKDYPGSVIERLSDKLSTVVETGISWENEVHCIDSGSWWYVLATKLNDGCIVLFTDITSEKKAESEILRMKDEKAEIATDKYLSLFNNMNQGFCIISLIFDNSGKVEDFLFLEINPAFKKLTGLRHAAGRTINELVPFLGQEWFDRFGEVAETGMPSHFEGNLEYLPHDVWLDVNVFLIGSQGNNHVAVLFNNITAKKRHQENFRCMLEKKVEERTAELIESRDFVKHITDTSPDIMYIINLAENKINYVSRGAVAFGYKPETIYAMGTDVFRILVHPDDYEERMANIRQMTSMKTEEVRESEFRLRDASGKWHWVNNRSTVFKYDDEGRPGEILGITQDITGKKEAENAYYSEKRRNEELKRINEVMDTFVFAAAHDLKAPISNLMLLTDAIELTQDNSLRLELQRKYRPLIEILNKTMSGMINVLSIEKDTGSAARLISFEKVFNVVKTELMKTITEVRPEMKADFSECPEIVYIESYLISIFRNMVSNSLKYRHPERRLKLEIFTEKKETFTLLKFSDNGIGIDLDVHGDNLFRPFRRISTVSEGTGIGLHLVRNIVTKNGGRIEVRSSAGKGTIFILYLVSYSKQ